MSNLITAVRTKGVESAWTHLRIEQGAVFLHQRDDFGGLLLLPDPPKLFVRDIFVFLDESKDAVGLRHGVWFAWGWLDSALALYIPSVLPSDQYR